MSDRFVPLIEELHLLIAERKELAATGPHVKMVHRFSEPGMSCWPGEEIAWSLLVHRSREYQLRLPTSLLMVFDYLAKNRRFSHSASQIAAGMRTDPFYLRHGANARNGHVMTRVVGRSSVKEYVKRIRKAFLVAFRDAGLKLDPLAILVSEPTESNEIRYRLRATVEWVHVP